MRKNKYPVPMGSIIAIALAISFTGDRHRKEITPLSSAQAHLAVNESIQKGEENIATFIARGLTEGKKPNRLIREKSPYLLQHAFNPVDWFPWGEEAFEKARREDKPVFLSIGYSTCYWCHVMEREVFENEEIAAFMNKYFISIKVDREERPDVDRIYMAALQAMTGRGGWPMSLFLTPDLKPFFGGTYIPPESKESRTGFKFILQRIQELWTAEREVLSRASKELIDFLQEQSSLNPQGKTLEQSILRRGFEQFKALYDREYGGFGSAPKFPRPAQLIFLLRYYQHTNNEGALNMVLHTRKQMAKGGIHDHIGGRFHRYSTDRQWHVPHFEKMLYDQAQLANAFLEAYQITYEPFYAQTARDILDYVLRVMTSPEGAFYSAEDTESASDVAQPEKKEEGAFYVWRKKIFKEREKRLRPHLDDKILVSWNGLMISAFAQGYQFLRDKRYMAGAREGAEFIKDKHMFLKTKDYYDGAEPTGNSVAVLNLLRLSELTNDPKWGKMAEKSLQLFAGHLHQYPQAMPQMLVALDFYIQQKTR